MKKIKESKFTLLLRIKASFIKFPFLSNALDRIFRTIFKCDIPSTVYIGKGSKFAHAGLGCVLHPRVKIGENCKVFQKTTITNYDDEDPPVIGDNVYIGAGAVIIGRISIGSNVRIGANAVVTSNVKANSTVLGFSEPVLNIH